MDPRPRCAIGDLEGPDFIIAPQRQCNLVEPLQQALAAARIDFKTVGFASWRSDRLLLQVDADASRALRDFDLRGEAIDNRLVDDDRQNAVLEAVGEEDIAKAGTD